MIRVLAVSLALAMASPALMLHSAFAGSSHHRGLGPSPRSYDPNFIMPAEAYSNCLAYSHKLRNYVWVCGAPYPPGIPALNSPPGHGEAYTNCMAYSRSLGTSVWVCGAPYPRGVPVFR